MAKTKILPNGRSAGKTGGFSQVPTDMQRSDAFRSLTPSALRLLLWCLFKNYKAATAESKADGKPTFKLTNVEAKTELGMNQQTFSRAKQELADKGFIEWVQRGGLRGANGVCSLFALSGGWKSWSAPLKEKRKPPAPHGKNLKSVKAA